MSTSVIGIIVVVWSVKGLRGERESHRAKDSAQQSPGVSQTEAYEKHEANGGRRIRLRNAIHKYEYNVCTLYN